MSSPATAPATTFEGLWNDLKAEATSAWNNLKAEAVSLEQKFVPVAEADIATGLSQFKTLAVNLVLSLAQQEFANLTGAQKNTITTASIIATAKSMGTAIVQQDAAMLAQQAFNAVTVTANTVAANAGH